jgi:phosphonate transport system substrate-binding protein
MAVRMFLPPAVSVSSGETALALWLGTQADVPMEVIVPQSEAEVLAAFAAGRADVAWLATPAYLLASERHGLQARWRGLRQGMSDYRGQWLVQADAVRQERDLAPLSTLEDLENTSVGYTDPHSTTGYLFPRAMLRQTGVRPASETFMGGDAQAVLAVYRGEVDAVATFWALPRGDATPGDARALIATAHPDVFARVKVLRLSDPIPNDPIVYRRDLDRALAAKLSLLFVELGRSGEGRALLQSLYGLNGLTPTQDSDYDGVRGANTRSRPRNDACANRLALTPSWRCATRIRAVPGPAVFSHKGPGQNLPAQTFERGWPGRGRPCVLRLAQRAIEGLEHPQNPL